MHRRGVNHEGRPDLFANFYVDKMNFHKGDTVGILEDSQTDGTEIQGTQFIRIAH